MGQERALGYLGERAIAISLLRGVATFALGSHCKRAATLGALRAIATLMDILNETQDGQWIKVRYVESDEDPSIVGTENLCHEDELQERIGTV